jgi:predicted small secreted protein
MEKKMKNIELKKHLIWRKMDLAIIASIPLLLGACNTMEGAGTDIQKAGRALEKSAERHKPNSPPCPSCPPHTRSYKTRT